MRVTCSGLENLGATSAPTEDIAACEFFFFLAIRPSLARLSVSFRNAGGVFRLKQTHLVRSEAPERAGVSRSLGYHQDARAVPIPFK
jgi:hypothetical protein